MDQKEFSNILVNSLNIFPWKYVKWLNKKNQELKLDSNCKIVV